MSELTSRPLSASAPGRGRALYVAVWLPCFGLYAAGIAATGVPPAQAVRGGLASVVPWAILGLFVLRAARAMPWPEEGRARVLLMHAGMALAFIVLTTAGWFGLILL